jgi:hypothetical protein
MRNTRNFFTILFLICFVTAMVGGLFWANLNFVQRVPGGADFIVPWKAIRNFVMVGVTPYGELTNLNIQSIIYDQPLLPGQYPYKVNLPLFVLMLFLPFGWISDLSLARAVWMIFLEGSILGVVFLFIRLCRWSPHWLFFTILLLFSVFWMPSALMLMTGTSIGLQTLVIFGAIRAIDLGSDELAGSLAALALVNVEATGLVLIILVVWALSAQRWRILGGMGMMLAVLTGISLLLMPSWILPFFNTTFTNWQSVALPSTYQLFEGWMPGIGQRLAQMLAIASLAILLMEARAVRGKDVRWLIWTVSLTAAITPLLGIPYTTSLLALTLPGVLLVVSVMVQRWGGVGLGGAVIVLLAMFLGLWGAQLKGYSSVFIFFFPLVLSLLLYWVRWGAVRPPRLWADEIVRH